MKKKTFDPYKNFGGGTFFVPTLFMAPEAFGMGQNFFPVYRVDIFHGELSRIVEKKDDSDNGKSISKLLIKHTQSVCGSIENNSDKDNAIQFLLVEIRKNKQLRVVLSPYILEIIERFPETSINNHHIGNVMRCFGGLWKEIPKEKATSVKELAERLTKQLLRINACSKSLVSAIMCLDKLAEHFNLKNINGAVELVNKLKLNREYREEEISLAMSALENLKKTGGIPCGLFYYEALGIFIKKQDDILSNRHTKNRS